ncbi:hypothetical protein GJ496_008913 [Pomphorhynchus laevis]|nr:hypothetical protein GJ496_008913 [Pomphorhynchus laevis]
MKTPDWQDVLNIVNVHECAENAAKCIQIPFSQNLEIDIIVVEHQDTQPLFGIPWILAMKFNMPPDVSFCQRKLSALSTIQHNGHENLKLSNVLSKYGDLFSNGICIIEQFQVKSAVQHDVKPI